MGCAELVPFLRLAPFFSVSQRACCMKHALVRCFKFTPKMATWHNNGLYVNQIVCIPCQGIREPRETDFHALKQFAPAVGGAGLRRFCMWTGEIPFQIGYIPCLTLFVPNCACKFAGMEWYRVREAICTETSGLAAAEQLSSFRSSVRMCPEGLLEAVLHVFFSGACSDKNCVQNKKLESQDMGKDGLGITPSPTFWQPADDDRRNIRYNIRYRIWYVMTISFMISSCPGNVACRCWGDSTARCATS
jgi:hypothetical protein